MLSAMNKERGKSLFRKKIAQERPKLSPDAQEKLDPLTAAFEDLVGIMPTEGVYAAARLSAACVIAAQESGNDDIPSLIASVMRHYGGTEEATSEGVIRVVQTTANSGRKKGTIIEGVDPLDDPDADPLLKAAAAEMNAIRTHSDFNYNGRNNPINLIKDFKKSDLSREGARARGFLPMTHDSTEYTGEEFSLEDEEKPLGRIRKAADGSVEEIECPFCFACDVYSAGLDRYGCFGCGEEFEVDIALDTQLDAGKGFWSGLVDEGVEAEEVSVIISGQEKPSGPPPRIIIPGRGGY